jgi:DNA-binding SARP family transcriptional activator/Tfp pilus assembly protein PilF
MAVEFRLLGEIDALLDGRPADIGHARQRCVLAVLLVEANGLVSVAQLAERVWAGHPPLRAAGTLYSYLSRLRRALRAAADVALVYRSGGYQLTVDPAAVDMHRFRALLRRAAAAGAGEHAVDLLEQALALWRGEPFAGLDTPWLNAVRDTLEAERLVAALELADLALGHGHHARLMPELAARAAAHPLDERVAGHYMLAAYRCGRAAEALAHYRELRHRLAEELGSDPGPALQELHQRILAADPALATARAKGAAPAGRSTLPRQLPAHTPCFVGRLEELGQLDQLLDATGQHPGTAGISVITGTAGIGKTTLAVHWAHRVADRFPDGQLYVNLRGFDPAGVPVRPEEALRGFLDAFEVPSERLPTGLDPRAAQYRSLLAGRKVLVVLDNARDAEQIRPLLPGSPGCFVVVTSRNHLAGLVAREGGRPLALDALSRAEAAALLAGHLGPERAAAEPGAVAALIGFCALLPLALAIVAARAAVNPGASLGMLADDLRDAHTRLDSLDAGDPDSRVRTVFSWSYQHLAVAAARLFRLLGVHPGPHISLAAAASLAGIAPGPAREALATLAGAHLVTERVRGRFGFHDLLRAYAADRAEAQDSVAGRREALRRVLDHYLHTAHTAALLLEPHRYPIGLGAPAPGVTVTDLAGQDQAYAWYDAEHPVLLAAVSYAAATGFDAHAWQLAWCLVDFLDRRGHWADWTATQDIALAAARSAGDPVGQARAHRSLGLARMRLGDHRGAEDNLRRALELDRATGDHTGQARTHRALAWVCEHLDRPHEALGHAHQAFGAYRTAGHRVGQARALNTVGWQYARLGDYRQALVHCEQALARHRELADPLGESDTRDTLAFAHHQLGHHRRAVAHYQHALAVLREHGYRYHESVTCNRLGEAQLAAGDADAARRTWQTALEILTELGHADAEQVQAKLAALDRDQGAGRGSREH